MVKKSEISKGIKNPKNAAHVAYARLNFTTGKMFFKNAAGFKANMEGRKTRNMLKRTHTKIISKEQQNPNISKFREVGFVNLEQPFDKKLFSQVKDKYEKMIEDDRYSFVRSEYNGKVYSRMLNRTFKIIPEIKELLTKDILDMIEEHYQGNFQILHVMLWRNYHVPSEVQKESEIFSSSWHNDGQDTADSTIFVNVSNVTEEDGPLHLQSIERTEHLIKNGFRTRRETGLPKDVLEDPNHVMKHVGPPGSTIWANSSLCFHRAGIPGPNRFRDLLQFRIHPTEEPLRDDWPKHCMDSLAEEKNEGEANVSNPSIT